jgi:hypothetical protein
MISCAKCQADPCQMVPRGARAKTRKTNSARRLRTVRNAPSPAPEPFFPGRPIVCVSYCAILDDSRFAEEERFEGEPARRTRTVQIASDLQSFTTATNALRNVRSVSVITARVRISLYLVLSGFPNFPRLSKSGGTVQEDFPRNTSFIIPLLSASQWRHGCPRSVSPKIRSMVRVTCSTDPRGRLLSLFTDLRSRVLKTIRGEEVASNHQACIGLRSAAADRSTNNLYSKHGRRTCQVNQECAELRAKDAMLTELPRCRRDIGSSLL